MHLNPIDIDYLTRYGYGHIQGYLSPLDVEAFRSIVERMPQHFRIVELGSLCGASAVVFTLLAQEMGKTCDILCIDRFDAFDGCYEKFLENTAPFGNIRHHRAFFDETYQYDGGVVDLYFDDASHEYEETLQQLRYWSKYAKNIAVHDYQQQVFPGVVRAVTEFSEEAGVTVEKFLTSKILDGLRRVSTVVYMELDRQPLSVEG